MPKTKTLIYIGIPIYKDMYFQTRKCFESLVVRLQQQGYGVGYSHLYGISVLPKARNEIAEAFLKTPAHYLMFFDADLVFPSNIVEHLLMMDKDITGAIYVAKSPPHYPILSKRDSQDIPHTLLEFPQQEIFQVDGIGTGCMLIKRKVFEAMKKPYFAMPRNYELGLTDGEDLDFCWEAKKLGYQVWANPMISKWVGHIGNFAFTLEDYWLHKQRAKDYGVTLTGEGLPRENHEDFVRGFIHREVEQIQEVESVVD